MFTTPAGPTLTLQQARDLDDALFGSHPMGYFHARIDSLLQAADDHAGAPRSGTCRAAFASLLGPAAELLDVDAADRELQVAVDAFAVRHHAAEALVRLYHALGVAEPGEPVCVWQSLVDGPTRTIDLVRQARSQLETQEGRDAFAQLVVPADVAAAEPEPSQQAAQVALAWLHRGMELLARDDIDINAAHNKVKHGLAVRPRHDMRSTLVLVPPNEDGTYAVSAVTGPSAIDVFSRTTLQFLSRPAQGPRRNAHLETTIVELVPERLLAEATMLSSIFGALFHGATVDHLTRHPTEESDTSDAADDPAEKHGADDQSPARKPPTVDRPALLPLGPLPGQLLRQKVVGLRSPVTKRPDGTPGRGTAIVLEDGFVVGLEVDIAGARTARLVEG